jgi:hypothetical protein
MNEEMELQAWRNWREACALALIDEEDRQQLTRVIADRFRSMLRKIQLHSHRNLDAPPDADCAHLFEAYCQMHQRRDGKKYKHWLLTRGRRDLDTVQSGVMLLVRNVVREWMRHNFPGTAPVSLQQPIGEGLSLEQLLPDTDRCAMGPEVMEWIHRQRTTLAETLEEVEKVVLLLRARGVVFSAPGVKREFGFGKSTLHKYHRLLLERLADELRGHFPGLSPEQGASVVLELLDGLADDCLKTFLAENAGSAAFGKVEDLNDPQD